MPETAVVTPPAGWPRGSITTGRGRAVTERLPALVATFSDAVAVLPTAAVAPVTVPPRDHSPAVVGPEQLSTLEDLVSILQGPRGSFSASWYLDGPHAPTWDFVVAHLHGRPTVLTAEETFDVLAATVDHLEADQPMPWRRDTVPGT